MKIIIISISILTTVFVFLTFTSINSSNLKKILKRLEKHKNGFNVKKRSKGIYDDLRFLIEEWGSIKIFKVEIKSIEGLFLLRIILAISSLIIFVFTGFLLGKNFIIYSLITAVILYFLPLEIIKGKINNISLKIRGELPDIVDILASLIKAGLSLDEAVTYIANNYSSEVGSLFKVLQVKIFEGYSKKEAYYSIARLSFCDDFKSIVKVLVQSDIIGNPIKDVLKDLSRTIRNNQRDLLKMKAEKLEGNLILIIFIFIFIPMLLLLLMPIIPQLKVLL